MLNRCDYLAVGLSNVSRLLLDCLVFRFLPFLGGKDQGQLGKKGLI